MHDYILFAIIGLTAGCIHAALAMGLVTTYRGTGVINFAQAAIAAWGAYTYAELSSTGTLVLPIGHIQLGGAWSAGPAFVAGVASAAVLGLVLYAIVFRPLRNAPPLAKVVATVGLMLTLDALITLRFGTDPLAVAPLLPQGTVEVAGLTFSASILWLVGLTAVLAVGLWSWARFTRTGIATRAGMENERAVSLSGYSPERLAAVTWVIASSLAAAIVILASPASGLAVDQVVLFVVPALACALLARLVSVPVACVAGLALGAMESELTLLSAKSWWPHWATVGISDAIPFVVVIIALVAFGRRIPSRGGLDVQLLPPVARPRLRPVPVAALIGAGVLVLAVTTDAYRFGVITSMIVAVMALSLVVLTGLVGQISLAQAAVAGTAGFALSKIGTGLPFPISTLAAALIAAVLGVAIGIPALRIRGAQLAAVTLAAAVATEQFVFNNPSLTPISGNPIPDPHLFGLNLAVRSGTDLARLPFGVLVLLVLVLAALAVANLMRSASGRAMLAVRSNERAAAAAGVNVALTKLVAFGFSAFLAGLAGTLIGYSRGQLSGESFTVFVGLGFLAFAYLGGVTSIGGALIAGTLAPLGIGYVLLNQAVSLGQYYTLVAGAGLVLVAVLNPAGIAGQTRDNVAVVSRVLARHRRRAGIVAQETGSHVI
jgi:branched-chain amino acid transport system permease protein